MHDNPPRRGARRAAVVVLIIVIAALYFLLSYNGVFYASDEGATVYHFEKTTEGAVQHRDFYSVYGMAFYIMGKWLFQIFGPKLIAVRLLTLVLKLVIAALIYFVTLRLTRPSFAFLSSMGFVIWWGDPFVTAPMYLYPAHVGQLLGLLAVLLLFIYNKNNRKLYIILAGLSVGLSGLFKPNLALFHLLCFFLFFHARELLLNRAAAQEEEAEKEAGEETPEKLPRKLPLGKAAMALETVLAVGAVIVMLSIFGGYGFDMGIFTFFLLPVCLVMAFIMIGALKVLQAPPGEAILRKHFKETLSAHLILAGGFAFWQLLQIAYFAKHGALGDFFHMLGTATSYYSNYGILKIWEAPQALLLCGVVVAIISLFYLAIWKTADSGPRTKMLVSSVALLLTLAVPASWAARRNIPGMDHFFVLSVPSFIAILAVLFLAYRGLWASAERKDLSDTLCIVLISFYAAINLLDAIPKIDLGHWYMVLPPILVLFGVAGERFYDLWKGYLTPVLPRAGRIMPRAIVGMTALQVFFPSLMLMLMFHVLIIPSAQRGYHLYKGKLALVPRHHMQLDRAKGIAIHALEDEFRPPLVDPSALDFFELAGRVSEITGEEDKIFSTMTGGLMLFFLADRDSVSDIANCYVWQTAMGTTTSADINDFSDRDLWETLMLGEPKAIIVEEGDIETDRFIENWPITWNFIQVNYRVTESVGAFQIYVPVK